VTQAAAVFGALGVAGILLARSRAALIAGLGVLGAATAVLAAAAPGGSLAITFTTPAGVVAAIVGLAIVGALAAALVRFPTAAVALLLLAAPLRLPIARDPGSPLLLGLASGGGLGRLYLFYAVLAAAAAALVWRLLRDDDFRPLPRAIAIPATALVALTSLSLLWSRDEAEGAVALAFFWLPFAALLAVVAHTPLTPRSERILATALVAEATVFAAIGIYQAAGRRLFFFDPDLLRANELGSLFRVTSMFPDPSQYGRHLVIAIAVVLVALWLSQLRLAVGAALVALLGAGLYFSYSQSSMVALAVVAVAVALLAGDRLGRRVVAIACLAIALVGAGVLAAAIAGGSAESVTSRRSTLVASAGTVFVNHPLIGVGVAAQPRVTRAEVDPTTTTGRNTSHTQPLTVAAELGVIGLVAYVAFLAGAVRVLLAAHLRRPQLALGLAAIFLALFAHSLFYPGFFENPITFGVLGLAAAVVMSPTDGPRESRTR